MKSNRDLEVYGLHNVKANWNLTPKELQKITLEKGMGKETKNGTLAINTGKFTGRSPLDRFIVKDDYTKDKVWWGKTNKPVSSENFDKLQNNIVDYLSNKELYVRDGYVCADPTYKTDIRTITEFPWSSSFVFNMFLRPTKEELESFNEEWLVLCAPGYVCDDPKAYGIRQGNFSIINFTKKIALVGGSAYTMWKSGARGSIRQISQMTGMKGLILNTRGETIEAPVISSFKEGLSPMEYFNTTHGSRKGLADTALQTAKAGYLTRRLFVVAQDAIVTEANCKTKAGTLISRVSASGIEIAFSKAIKGRILAADAMDTKGNVIFKKGHLMTRLDSLAVEASTCESVEVRSPMTCATLRGVCQQCYGTDLTKNELIDIGEAVGTIAAQAIGEPGTQLTMNTKHKAGTATAEGDVAQGLPRVEEVFEKRQPKIPAVIAKYAGLVTEIRTEGRDKFIMVAPDMTAEGAPSKKDATEYAVDYRRVETVSKGDTVTRGQLLTDGSCLLPELFKFAGQEATQDYIIAEVNKIYELQGVTISRKHIELIVKQMMSRKKITERGESRFTPGEVVEEWVIEEENTKLKVEGKDIAKGDRLIMGITETSLSRKSFLSAASFQNTTRVLINAAVRGSEDNLAGLMENVIIGKLIPAGSGFEGSKKHEMIKQLQAEQD